MPARLQCHLYFYFYFFASLRCIFFSLLSYIMQRMQMYISRLCMGSEGLVCFDRSEWRPGCVINNWLLRCCKSCKQSKTQLLPSDPQSVRVELNVCRAMHPQQQQQQLQQREAWGVQVFDCADIYPQLVWWWKGYFCSKSVICFQQWASAGYPLPLLLLCKLCCKVTAHIQAKQKAWKNKTTSKELNPVSHKCICMCVYLYGQWLESKSDFSLTLS